MLQRRFPVSRLLFLGCVLILGCLLPAAARVLDRADTFTLLSGGTILATAPTTVNGMAGAVGTTTGPLSATTTAPMNGSQVQNALADLAAARTKLSQEGGSFTSGALGGQSFSPGIYQINGAATIADGQTVFLSGFGNYVFNVTGSLTVGNNVTISLSGGAVAANVYWNVGGAVTLGSGDNFAGNLLAPGSVVVGSGLNMTGKILSQSGSVALGGGTLTNSVVGTAPFFVSPTPADNTGFTVCVGDTLNFVVAAQDVDQGDTVRLSVSGTPVGAGQLPNTGGADNNGPLGDDLLAVGPQVSSRFSWSPLPQDVGIHPITYSITDNAGNLSQTSVTVTVSQRPTFSSPTPANGQLFTACPGQAFAYTVTATDPDTGTFGALTLTDAGAPANLIHSGNTATPPALNVTGAGTVSTNATITPTANQAGQTFTVTYTVTDGAGCSSTTVVRIRVDSVPQFTAPTPADETVFSVCAGQPVEFHVRAVDADSGDLITLSASGLPATALQEPALPTVSNPAESEFSWTPRLQDVGLHTITYTATDNSPAACFSQTSVIINVLQPTPTTVTLTMTGNTMVDQQLCFTGVVRDQCQQVMPGVSLTYQVLGTTGSNQTVVLTTDANGSATFCFTPLFSGTDTVTAFVDLNHDGILEAGEPLDTKNMTIDAPPSTLYGSISGSGAVDALGLGTPTAPTALFYIGANVKKNGSVSGTLSITVPLSKFTVLGYKFTGMTVADGPDGKPAVLFGTMKSRPFGNTRFRVDALDAGTPGVPNDRFVLTLLTSNGLVTCGGNLRYVRSPGTRLQNDIVVRLGMPLP